MEKLTLLVADSQVVVKQHLLQELKKDRQIQVVGTAGDGKEAYELFVREQPKVTIFDLLLPVYDGYTLLNKMRKPYDTTVIADKIKKIYNRMNRPVMKGGLQEKKDVERIYYKQEKVIAKKLNEIGIPARLKGYRYMITAVERAIENSEALESVTKILYPDVAKEHNSTAQRVEKAIRHAIEVAWSAGGNSQANKEFQYIISPGKTRPTNSEFIAKIAQDIKLT